jgi:hypothetical protein
LYASAIIALICSVASKGNEERFKDVRIQKMFDKLKDELSKIYEQNKIHPKPSSENMKVVKLIEQIQSLINTV